MPRKAVDSVAQLTDYSRDAATLLSSYANTNIAQQVALSCPFLHSLHLPPKQHLPVDAQEIALVRGILREQAALGYLHGAPTFVSIVDVLAKW